MSVYDDLLRSYRQRQDLAKHADAMRRVMNPLGSTLEGLRQMQEAYERTRRLYAGPADYVRELQEKLQFLQTLQMPRYEAELANWLRLQSGLSQSGVSDVAIRQLATTSTLQMQKALQDITAQLNRPSLNGFPAKLQSVLYSPPLAYSSFARRSIESAAQETREKSQVIQASVVLAESQVEDGTHILTAALEGMDESVGEPSDSEETTVAAVDSDTLEMPAAETLFSTQQTELLAAAGDLSPMSEYETLLANSPTAHQLQLAHELCQLVVDLNQARKLISEEELFPPTTAMLSAINLLVYTGVKSKIEMGVAIDCLYVLLYEGSGEAKRITKWVTSDRCEPLWALKQLRNVWLRHDPEHGSEGDQAKKWRKLREGLAFLGVTTLPTSEAEFLAVYSNLLRALLAMMEEVKFAVFSAEGGAFR